MIAIFRCLALIGGVELSGGVALSGGVVHWSSSVSKDLKEPKTDSKIEPEEPLLSCLSMAASGLSISNMSLNSSNGDLTLACGLSSVWVLAWAGCCSSFAGGFSVQ